MILQNLSKRAESLDTIDALSHLVDDFCLPADCIYLDGNSLGPLPLSAKQRAREVVELQWGDDLITSWNKHAWISLPQRVGAKIAPLLGSLPEQVIACDSISVNLSKVLCAALNIQQHSSTQRNVVISQQDNFPTDLYMVQGLSELVGPQRCSLISVPENKILSAIEEYADTAAVLMLTHVNFRSGRIHDMQAITKAAHAKGILVIWDLAHSAGVLDLELDKCEVDFAVGCTYKYLNGGPGAPAFIYAAKRHWDDIKQPLSGWMGHKKPFDFAHDYSVADGMTRFLVGTPPVVSMSILDAALDTFDGISTKQIRAKSVSLTQFFQDAFNALIEDKRFTLITPNEHALRGSQLAFSHPQAYAICQALIAHKVIADFRAPDILRIGFSPLFLTHKQLLDAVLRLKEVLDTEQYLLAEFQTKQAVT
ncbi:kynureninase [Glaciecola sp. SC05]|uniref:kynureninase n=1 Tax=Glaciecola sp. SC05 TaxID=1987355 RepID=UPI0035282F48